METDRGHILVLNAGSSSLKLAVFAPDGDTLQVRLRGGIELSDTPVVTLTDADRQQIDSKTLPSSDLGRSLPDILSLISSHLGTATLAAAGHRVVHGGPRHAGPARVTPDLLRELEQLTPLAPLHQGPDLAPIRALLQIQPNLPQVVSFDTAFHLGMPDAAARFAIPDALHAAGVRRYGAHGLSYAYIADRLRRLHPTLASGRVVVAHLGSGASLCALHDGRSVDTTMGLTPLDGLVMATRCGTLDPGAVLYLQQAHGMSVQAVQDMLYHQSGLLGVSGTTGDMRRLLNAPEPAARAAVDLFIFRLGKEVAGMVAALGGLDALVFTGGIGQHEPGIRQAAVDRLAFLGLALDPAANQAASVRVDAAHSAAPILVLPTDEEQMIARETRHILRL